MIILFIIFALYNAVFGCPKRCFYLSNNQCICKFHYLVHNAYVEGTTYILYFLMRQKDSYLEHQPKQTSSYLEEFLIDKWYAIEHSEYKQEYSSDTCFTLGETIQEYNERPDIRIDHDLSKKIARYLLVDTPRYVTVIVSYSPTEIVLLVAISSIILSIFSTIIISVLIKNIPVATHILIREMVSLNTH